MRRARARALIGFAASAMVTALASANCGAPTQIIIDVHVDSDLCGRQLKTAIAVAGTDVKRLDAEDFDVYQDECDGPGDLVGTLTITPSGDNDAEVGVRIVAAIDGADPDACGRNPDTGEGDATQWSRCILARRYPRFVPGTTVYLTVKLSKDCLNKYCGGEEECNTGQCVKPEQIQPDSGTAPEPDVVTPPPDKDVDVKDAVTEEAGPPIDAGSDACLELCPKGNCDMPNNRCTVTCNNGLCKNDVVCKSPLQCIINCTAANACEGTRCTSNKGCDFNCTGGNAGSPYRCLNVGCSGSSCRVNCGGSSKSCSGVYLDAAANEMHCTTTGNQTASCDVIECWGGTCERSCADGGLGCGYLSRCSGDCGGWEDGGDGGDGSDGL